MDYPSKDPPAYSTTTTPSGYPQQQYQPVPTQVYVTSPQPPPATTVVMVDVVDALRCARCQNGMVREHFTLCGWLWAIFFFPLGLICLFSLRLRSCNRCGAIY